MATKKKVVRKKATIETVTFDEEMFITKKVKVPVWRHDPIKDPTSGVRWSAEDGQFYFSINTDSPLSLWVSLDWEDSWMSGTKEEVTKVLEGLLALIKATK